MQMEDLIEELINNEYQLDKLIAAIQDRQRDLEYSKEYKEPIYDDGELRIE